MKMYERKDYVKEYVEFMYNIDNEYNCSECPENREYDDFQHRLPCGQQNCWVTAHCRKL